MALKDSQKDMQEHSAKKVELLQRYLNAYLGILGRAVHTDAVHCFDLFCGEGVYPNGGEGSPMVFVRTLLAASHQHASTRFTFRYNDKEAAKVENVTRNIQPLLDAAPHRLVTTASQLPFASILAETKAQLAKLRKEKAFVFLDPYGYKESKPGMIAELMAGSNTEVLLWMPTQQMFRFSKNGTPEALDDFLASLAFDRPFPVNASIRDYIEHIKEGFRLLVPDCFVDTFTLKKDATTAFCVFFFTSHIRGAEKMLDAKWALDTENGEGWSFEDEGLTPSLFAGVAQKNRLLVALESALAKGPLTNKQIYELTIRSGHRPTHAVEILKAFQAKGRILVSPAETKKGAFFISYEATFGSDPTKLRTITIQLL